MFTPGPWRVGQDREAPGYNIIKQTSVNRGRYIAQLYRGDNEDQSNAALIALAPEMYSLLLRVHSRMVSCTPGARARTGGSIGTVLAAELHQFALHMVERVNLYEYERDTSLEG